MLRILDWHVLNVVQLQYKSKFLVDEERNCIKNKPMQTPLKQLEQQNIQLITRIKQLEAVVEHWNAKQLQQESMVRKQLFRLHKEHSHLSAKLNWMEEQHSKQAEISKALVRWALYNGDKKNCDATSQTSQAESDASCYTQKKATTALNFNPIYD